MRARTLFAALFTLLRNVPNCRLDDGSGPTVAQIDAIQKLYREHLKLAEDEKRMLDEEPHDIRKNLEILAALRDASSAADPVPRSLSTSKVRKPKPLGKAPDVDGPSDSPGPALSRVKGSSSVRSTSLASRREGTVDRDIKMEDGAKGTDAERAGKLVKGAEVAYKQAKPKEDGSQWIQCIILQVIEKGSTKRYEVQDPEPDEHGNPGEKYRTTAGALIAIPPPDTKLADYEVGRQVLARYPETTTFYRAEVLGTTKTKDGSFCRLKFEDDQNQVNEVMRRYVLDVSGK